MKLGYVDRREGMIDVEFEVVRYSREELFSLGESFQRSVIGELTTEPKLQAFRARAEMSLLRVPLEKIYWDVRTPATWWQHFKQAWFPGWLLRRFPVKCDTHSFEGQMYICTPCPGDMRLDGDRLRVSYIDYNQLSGIGGWHEAAGA